MSMNDYENDEAEKYYENDKDEKRIVLFKRLGIILLVIIGIILILLLLKNCGKQNKPIDENGTTLLEGAKEYYENNTHLLPKNIGECSEITLKELLEKGILISNKFEGCDGEKTYVKVCMVESKSLQWTPFKLCGDEDTEKLMGQFIEGKESDLIKDESDVMFTFLGQYLDLNSAPLSAEEEYWQDEIPYNSYKTIGLVNYYRYRELQYIWNIITKYYYTSTGEKTNPSSVQEYYITSPETKYTDKEGANKNAAKWYTVVGRDYYKENGEKKAFSETSFTHKSEYPEKELAYVLNAYRTKTIWNEVGKPTTYSPTHYYYCTKSATDTTTGILSFQPCREQLQDNPLYGYQLEDFYSCTGLLTNKVSKNSTCYKCTTGIVKEDNTSCGNYSWTNWGTTSCDTTSQNCQMVSDNRYYWYKKSNENRTYYPSGSAVASKEKVYYVSSPKEGAIKDESTQTTAYKWYRTVNGQTSKYYTTPPSAGATKTNIKKYTDWTEWTTSKPSELKNGTRNIETKVKVKLQQILSSNTSTWNDASKEYLTREEMIKSLQDLGFKVNSLSDINSSGDVTYKVKMYYRNKEVK